MTQQYLPEHTGGRKTGKRQKKLRRRRWVKLVLLLALLWVALHLFSAHGRTSMGQPFSSSSTAKSPLPFSADRVIENADQIPEELLELAENNPETLDFVQQYPELHDSHPDIDLSGEARSDSVPLLLQWDTRWGYESYGSGMIAWTGCGPTCLSMAALYLTGNAAVTPLEVAHYAEESGYYVDGQGTSWTLISEGAAHFGLTAEELPLSEARMRQTLVDGGLVICAMGPGDFTTTGHYIVLTGCNDEGFTVNDPNSILRSGEVWDYETLSGQIRNLWALF